jgi:hypothetical protein
MATIPQQAEPTPQARQAQEDLQFVRRAVARDSGGAFPLSIAVLWSAIAVIGFALVDFAPERSPLFWLVAGPGGFALSLWLGGRSARHAGEVDRAEAWRWAAHWGGLLAAIALATLSVVAGDMNWQGFGATLLLLMAVAYFTAGIHLHRSLLLVAAILAAGYPAVLFVERYAWTVVGAAVAAALLAGAFAGRGRGGE